MIDFVRYYSERRKQKNKEYTQKDIKKQLKSSKVVKIDNRNEFDYVDLLIFSPFFKFLSKQIG